MITGLSDHIVFVNNSALCWVVSESLLLVLLFMDLVLSVDWLSNDNLLSSLLESLLSAFAPSLFSPFAATPVRFFDAGELFEDLLSFLEAVNEEEVRCKKGES